MSWDPGRRGSSGQLLPLPDDGIAMSNHPPGWLGKRWRGLLEATPPDCRDRLRRGKNYARRGRLRGLHVAPGCAAAEVNCEEAYRPTVRVRTFSRQEWAAIRRELTADLNQIASLLEGELPAELVQRLEARNITMLPAYDELSFDCDCGDYVMPCAHVATLFHVLTDALDGDPFLLLTMRGRDREHLLSQLRSDWGDDTPITERVTEVEAPVPEHDWYASQAPVPSFPTPWGATPAAGAGLRALGPPPGDEDLLATLMPLYEAGHVKLREMIEALDDRPVPRRRTWTQAPSATQPAHPAAEAEEDDATGLTERVVEAIAEGGGCTSDELARMLDLSIDAIRGELVDLLGLGLVYRQAEKGHVRWFLG